MISLRVTCRPELADSVIGYLSQLDLSAQIAHLPGACRSPAADLILCDVPREAGSAVIAGLRDLGIEDGGAILVHGVDAAVSQKAAAASVAAPGAAADAVLWEEVSARTSESAELTGTYLVFMIVATIIAAVAVLVDSLILVVGAMVVGPEFGPLAGVCVAAVERRWPLAARSMVALVVGFVVALAVTGALVQALRWTGVAPGAMPAHPNTAFLARPDVYSAIVAALAGVVGMLSLTTAKSGALIGVLISVTTIPAAGDAAVAASYGAAGELSGALAQLGLNLALLLVAGLATLWVQRRAFARRVRQLLAPISWPARRWRGRWRR